MSITNYSLIFWATIGCILFKQYDNDELTVLDGNDDDEENEIMAGFMPSQLANEMARTKVVSLF